MSSSKKSKKLMKLREEGFDLNSVPHARLKPYNALHDPNMRHYFENPNVQRHLYKSGQIDRHGRVIDLDKSKSKVHILEREFKEAERIEQLRLREEMEMRYRVQRKRFNELEKARKEEILGQLKADRELSHEILNTVKSSTLIQSAGRTSLSRSCGSSRGQSPDQDSMFFVTEG